MYKLKLISLVALFILSTNLIAQTHHSSHGSHHHVGSNAINKNKQSHAINFLMANAGLGLASYYGDLCDNFDCFRFRHSISLGAYYRINKHFAAGGNLFWTRVSNGDRSILTRDVATSSLRLDDPVDGRNLSFRSDILEFSVYGMYDIFPFDYDFKKRIAIEPYLFAGIGVFHYSPRANLDGTWHKLRPLQLEGEKYSNFAVTIPFGIGVRDKIAPNMNIGIEMGYRFAFTDYLDDVSKDYYTHHDDPLKASLSDRTETWGSANGQLLKRPSRGEDGTWYNELGEPVGSEAYEVGQYKRGSGDGFGTNDGYFVFAVKFEYMLWVPKTQHYKGRSGNINRVFEPKHFKKRH